MIRTSLNHQLIIGGLILTSVISLAVIAFIWTPYDPNIIDIQNRFALPSRHHLFGTDHFGRDILSMVMIGAQISLGVAISSICIALTIGVPLGIAAAANHRRKLDDVIMRSNDLIFAFPSLVVAILIAARFGAGASNAIIAIALFNIPVFARVARAAALPLWQCDFISAARLTGKSNLRIAFEHVLPNASSALLTQATIQLSLAVLIEAGLSYIGLGTQPPQSSWGRMLAESQTLVAIAPHSVLVPGSIILITVLGFNLLGDGFESQHRHHIKNIKPMS